MQVNGIRGGSTEARHREWIDVTAVDLRVTPITGGHSASVAFQDVVVAKPIDRASPLLFRRMCDGQNLGRVTIEATKYDPHQGYWVWLSYELANACILGFRALGGAEPSEAVTLSYTGITIKRVEHDRFGNVLPAVTYEKNALSTVESPVETAFDVYRHSIALAGVWHGFVQSGQIAGDSQDSNHQSWIDIDGLSFAFSRASASGRGDGRLSAQALVATKAADTSGGWAQALTLADTGTALTQVTIELTRTIQGVATVLRINLENGAVSVFSPRGVTRELLSIGVQRAKWEYDDGAGSLVTQGWDFATNQPW
jgi:type VI secretion system secreted protein Hcp